MRVGEHFIRARQTMGKNVRFFKNDVFLKEAEGGSDWFEGSTQQSANRQQAADHNVSDLKRSLSGRN